MQQSSERKQFAGIQALRALAAVMVVVFHATGIWSQQLASDNHCLYWNSGAAGVDLFFVISGFVMALSCLGRPDLSAASFMRSRIIRIVPMYWLVTAFFVVRSYLPGHVSDVAITAHSILASLLFIPFRNSLGAVQPIVIVGWTLCFEMFFYGLIAVALLFRVGIVRFVAPAIIILTIAGFFLPHGATAITDLMNPILLEFLAGFLLGRATLSGFRINAYLSALLGIVGLAAILHFTFTAGDLPIYRPIKWGIPALLIVQTAVMLEGRIMIPAWVLGMGGASYSLYLTHLIVIQRVFRHLGHDAFASSEMAMTAVCLLASVVAAKFIYRFVEYPLLQAAKNASAKKERVAAWAQALVDY